MTRRIYKEGDDLNGFRLIGPAHDKSGGWYMICKICGDRFVGRPKPILTGKNRSCGCVKRQEARWLDIVGFPEVLRLKQQGLSSSQIASRITEKLIYLPDWNGTSVTKNMVLGVISRRAGSKKSVYTKLKPPLPARDSSDTHSCAYPLGDPGKADFRFCHEPLREFGAPYCVAHMGVAYMPLPPRPVRL